MRRATLVLLLVVPNTIAGIVVGYFLIEDFNQVVGIGTLAGVFYVAYSALMAPWVSGYLEDKRAHSVVLKTRFFGAYELLDTGNPGLISNLSPHSLTLQGKDRYRTHLLMEIRGRRTDPAILGGSPSWVWTPLIRNPAYPSACSHMRDYPEIYSTWKAAQAVEDIYNRRRTEVLDADVQIALPKMQAEYPALIDASTNRLPRPGSPHFDIACVVLLAYQYALEREFSRGIPLPNVREVTVVPSNRKGIGTDSNLISLIAETPADRDIQRFLRVVEAISREPAFVAGVRQLCDLEHQASVLVSDLQRLFGELSIRIELGHRIQGTCSETGY
jgi:hypothetical protein